MITEKVDTLIVRRSSKEDCLADIIMMDTNNPNSFGGYKANLDLRQCIEIRDLLNKFIIQTNLDNISTSNTPNGLPK